MDRTTYTLWRQRFANVKWQDRWLLEFGIKPEYTKPGRMSRQWPISGPDATAQAFRRDSGYPAMPVPYRDSWRVRAGLTNHPE